MGMREQNQFWSSIMLASTKLEFYVWAYVGICAKLGACALCGYAMTWITAGNTILEHSVNWTGFGWHVVYFLGRSMRFPRRTEYRLQFSSWNGLLPFSRLQVVISFYVTDFLLSMRRRYSLQISKCQNRFNSTFTFVPIHTLYTFCFNWLISLQNYTWSVYLTTNEYYYGGEKKQKIITMRKSKTYLLIRSVYTSAWVVG